MLEITSKYLYKQFQGKLINLSKMVKNLVWPKFRSPIFYFFSKIWLRQSLDIMVSNHHAQYQKKPMIQS